MCTLYALRGSFICEHKNQSVKKHTHDNVRHQDIYAIHICIICRCVAQLYHDDLKQTNFTHTETQPVKQSKCVLLVQR